jgi:UDP-N-acetylmuramoylalanine--D-glutamate ligase
MTLELKNKQVLVIGLGRSGQAAARFLNRQGAIVTLADEQPESHLKDILKSLQGCYQHTEFGKHTLKDLSGFDWVVTSPGVRDEKILNVLEKHADKVIPEVELGLHFFPNKVIGITGTNGKTTTGEFIHQLLSQLNINHVFCGNNGYPVCDLLMQQDKALPEWLVVELSSFMLQWFKSARFTIGVVLNVSAHHVKDHAGSFDHYLNSKLNLARFTKPFLILNALDPHLQEFRRAFQGQPIYFSRRNLQKFVNDNPKLQLTHVSKPDKIQIYNGLVSPPTLEIPCPNLRLRGEHNLDNLIAALTVAYYVNPKHFAKEVDQLDLQQLKPPKYRLQLVFDRDKIQIFNDAKSTNVMSVMSALRALEGPMHLILGGYETHEDFHPLIPIIKQKVKSILLMGQSKERLNRVLGEVVDTYLVGSVEEALLLAYQKSRNGEQILFSPGFPSYDMFKNFEERGEVFNKFIAKL